MKVGFIGLGIMGSRMAANLLSNGVELMIHNRTTEKGASLLDQGATWAEKPADLAEAEVVFSMLAHPDAVLALALGEGGFLNALRPGSLWVDCSTVHPRFSREMAAAAAAREVRFLEAPVAGTKPQAQNGQLVFFAGGNAADLEEVTPLLNHMGQKIVHVGEHGMATSLKVVINLLLASSMATFAEGLALGEALGLPQETLLNTLIGGPVVPSYLASKRVKIENDDFEPQFPLRWMQKDLQMAAVAAYEAGVALPQTNATKELFMQAVQAGLGDLDFAAIVKSR
ncbi:MAG: NAD(P)-dependent oxidoreductase [Ardenticatenaceae bacterium]|nr:NAD(P)-dependent oxidoreductase [Ardenticatenaceae bacterium]